MNLYTYVYNNSMIYTDPSGHMGQLTCAYYSEECQAKKAFNQQLQVARASAQLKAVGNYVSYGLDSLIAFGPAGTELAVGLKSIGYSLKYVAGVLKAVFAESKAMKVVNLGAGDNIIQGVINTDIRTGTGIDLVIDASKALPYANESIDALIAINPYQYAAVNEFTTAALKPGGTFTLVETLTNPWFKMFYNASADDLKTLGYELVSSGKASDALKYGTKTTDGIGINPDKLYETILKKIGG